MYLTHISTATSDTTIWKLLAPSSPPSLSSDTPIDIAATMYMSTVIAHIRPSLNLVRRGRVWGAWRGVYKRWVLPIIHTTN